MTLVCINKKSVVSRKELSTPVNPSVLQDPLTRTKWDVINHLGNTFEGNCYSRSDDSAQISDTVVSNINFVVNNKKREFVF